jgi:hypothetical protein
MLRNDIVFVLIEEELSLIRDLLKKFTKSKKYYVTQLLSMLLGKPK